MQSRSTSSRIVESFEAISEWSGRIASWLLLGIILMSIFFVVVDKLLPGSDFASNFSIKLENLKVYLFGIMFMTGIAYTLKHDNHVRVDIFYRNMSLKRKAWVNLVGTIIFLLPICGVLLYYCTGEVINSWSNERGSAEAGSLGYIYIVKTFMIVMPVLLLLQGLANLIKLSRYLFRDGEVPHELVEKKPDEMEQV